MIEKSKASLDVCFVNYHTSADHVEPSVVTAIHTEDSFGPCEVDLVVFNARIPRGNYARPVMNVLRGTGVGEFEIPVPDLPAVPSGKEPELTPDTVKFIASGVLQDMLAARPPSSTMTKAEVQALVSAEVQARTIPVPSAPSAPAKLVAPPTSPQKPKAKPKPKPKAKTKKK